MDAAHAWFVAVTRRKKCVVCQKPHSQMQGHHVIAQEVLRAEFPYGVVLRYFDDGRPYALGRNDDFGEFREMFGDETRTLQQLLWDVRNGIALCPADHERHTSAAARVPRAKLGAAAFAFALELNLQHRLGSRYYA